MPTILDQKMDMREDFVQQKLVKRSFWLFYKQFLLENTFKHTYFSVPSEKLPSGNLVNVYNGDSDSKSLYRIF